MVSGSVMDGPKRRKRPRFLFHYVRARHWDAVGSAEVNPRCSFRLAPSPQGPSLVLESQLSKVGVGVFAAAVTKDTNEI
jgi:hypothetical protein